MKILTIIQVAIFNCAKMFCHYGVFFILFFTEALVGMGYSRSEIEDSLTQAKYDDVFATYLLLGRKSTDVSFYDY